jgi:hypothetical protein
VIFVRPRLHEDPFDRAVHEDGVGELPEQAEGEGVLDRVGHQGAVGRRHELVRVAPEAVGAPDLHVDEALRGIEGVDQGRPSERDPEEPQAVVDSRPAGHGDGPRRDDVEVEEVGGDGLEVPRVAEEGEDVRSRTRNELDPLEPVEPEPALHGDPPIHRGRSMFMLRFAPRRLTPRRAQWLFWIMTGQ